MAEKKLAREELDQFGLSCVEIDWDNTQKLTALFHHYTEKKEPLPAFGVNDQGDATPNLSLLARLAKVIQGKQVFKRIFARKLLEDAIKQCGIEDLSKTEEKDETQAVRKHLQSGIDEARRNASNTDRKLKEALDNVAALKAEIKNKDESIAELKAKLAVANSRAGDAENRALKGSHQERKSLKRVFG